jgi:hypothetical protein
VVGFSKAGGLARLEALHRLHQNVGLYGFGQVDTRREWMAGGGVRVIW